MTILLFEFSVCATVETFIEDVMILFVMVVVRMVASVVIFVVLVVVLAAFGVSFDITI